MPIRLKPRASALSILLLTLATIVHAQCTQATRSQAASPDAATESSSDTAAPVRFATGTAVTVLENTPLQLMNDMPISSRTTKEGAKLSFTLTRDVIVDGILVIPCGATVYGTIVSAKQAGRLVGASHLTLQLTALTLDGRSYPLYTPPFKVVAASKTRPTVDKVAAGGAVGALTAEATFPRDSYTIVNGQKVPYTISAADHAKGDALVAGVGGSVGLAIAASTPPSIVSIPAESQMEFTLAAPIAVYPVDQRTATRLARGMHQGGPVLYVRGEP